MYSHPYTALLPFSNTLQIQSIVVLSLLLLVAASPAWTVVPTEGLALHLDASTLSGRGKAAAGPVPTWKDLSGKGNDLHQEDAGEQPRFQPRDLHGKPAVVFTGEQWLDGPAVLPPGLKSFTFVAVWKREAAGGSQSVMEQSSPGTGRRACLLTVNRAYGFNGESNDQHSLIPFQPGKFAVSILRLEPGGKVMLFHNGYPKSGLIDIAKQNIGNDRFRLGAKIWGGGERLNGAVAEVMVYDRALSDDEAKQITRDLVKKWRIQVEQSDPAAAAYLEMIRQNAANPARYTEMYRPQYHFTPIEGWMNDPNGLVYFHGLWHLFYQHNAAGEDASKSWGHAVSKDLVHWEHRPPAITPDEKGAIWSGSAVVDQHDSSGFFGGKPGLVCIYTYMNPAEGNRQSQGIAYSPDGITFTTYDKNPVIPQLRYQPGQPDESDFRDPKVFWHEATKRWVMIVAGGKVRFYSSPNLRDWTFESINLDIQTECPDLFELPVEGAPGQSRWVLSGAGRWYMLGSFDGKVFKPESGHIPVNYGPDFYASQTWNDVPDGRRLLTTWMYGWGYGGQFPGRPGGGMTIPVVLSLRRTPDGIRLFQAPARELQALRADSFSLKDRPISQGETLLPEVHGRQLEMIAEFEQGSAGEFGLRVRKGADGIQTTVGYRVKDGKVFLDRRSSGYQGLTNWLTVYEAPLTMENGRVKLHLFVDWSSVELLANDGREAITCNLIAPPAADGVELYAEGGDAHLVSLEVYPLKTVWRTAQEEQNARPHSSSN